jgi:hypothetical protein
MTASGSPQITPRAAPRRVLEDASGQRLRRMRWVGRAVAVFFLGWLAVVILGGLGVGPASRVPLGHLLRPSAGPPPARHQPRPHQPSPSDLVPARPAPLPATGGGTPTTSTAHRRLPHGKSSSAHGRSGSAPGHTGTIPHGKSAAAKARTHGRSAVAPGRARRATTTTTATTTAVTTTTAPGARRSYGQRKTR